MIKKLLIVFIAVFTFTTNVSAASFADGTYVGMAQEYLDGATSVFNTSNYFTYSNGEVWSNNVPTYRVTVSGNKYYAICLDPSLSEATTLNHVIDYEVGNRTYSDDATDIYDEGLLAIFSYFEDKEVNQTNYMAEVIAIRVLTMSVNYSNGSKDAAYAAIADVWNAEFSSYVNTIKSNGLTFVSYGSTNSITPNDVGQASYDTAKSAYEAALKAMTNYDGNSDSAYLISTTTTNASGNTVVTLTAAGFTGDSTSKLTSLSVDTDADSYSCSVITSSGTYSCATNSDIALQNGDKIVVTFTTASSNAAYCDDKTYTIDYTIEDGSLSGGSAYVIKYSGNTTSDVQRFIFYVPGNDGEKIGSFTGNISVCANACVSDYEIVTDCEEFITDNGLDGSAENEWYSESYYDANFDIFQCDTDAAGSSLQVEGCTYDDGTDNGMSNVTSDNDYCTVSCKEDYYDISFPGVQSTDSGRYFKINATISGTKTCYTSEILYDDFVDDIVRIQEEMVAAYNTYMSASAAIEAGVIKYNEESYCSCGDYENCNGEITKVYDILYGYEGTSNYTKAEYTHIFMDIDETTGIATYTTAERSTGYADEASKTISQCKIETCSKIDDDGNPYLDTCCSNGSGSSGDISSAKNDAESAKAIAASALNTLYNEFIDAITDITSCAGGQTANYSSTDGLILSFQNNLSGWSMEYVINPVIEYSYAETGYMNLITENSDKYMVLTNNSSTSFNGYEYCSVLSSDGTCSSSSTSTTQTVDFVFCTTSGCYSVSFSNFPTDYLNYVTASSDKDLEYETPEVFYNSYPSGTVLYSTDGVFNSDDDITLIDGLPVSLTTEKGLYEFKYTISNWGEYYDDCTGGRINEELDFLESDSSFSDMSYDYVCYYKVNCPNCDITTEFDWDEEEVCISCIINGSFTMYFRTITTTDDEAFTTDREPGYNWNYSYVNHDTYGFISSKAYETYSEIYKLGDTVYSGDAILTVELNNSIASEIREYNDENPSYSNDTLACEDYGSYENVICYSELLTKWADDYSDYFEFTSDRNGNVTSDISSGYWTVYTTGLVVTTYSIGGPSWK